MLKTTFIQFLIVRQTQRYNPLLPVTVCDLDSDRQIKNTFLHFTEKIAVRRIGSSFVTGQISNSDAKFLASYYCSVSAMMGSFFFMEAEMSFKSLINNCIFS